nr:MAG TPA: hypothetical protein [Caudoviricetes sp.]
MNDLMQMQSLPIKKKEYDGQPVVTFRDVDELHQKNEGTARKRFNDNRKHFQEGVDYFVLNSDEASSRLGIIAPCGLKLLTQTGYLMIVKSFTDDLSWAIQRELVNGYFAARQAGCTFMGTPVTPLHEAAKSLGLSPRAARERVARGGFGMGDALLLEGRNFARFKRENNLRVTTASLWIVTRSGYEKLKALSAAPRLAEQT